ncbi:MAG: citrate (Si)-synthase [Chlamydiales bacterium]|nr:citrate (Si)-synthase [Chlamydiia bacterium]MCP5508143.1 citrate (Si)-synthase [Chlamydiales bacterium]
MADQVASEVLFEITRDKLETGMRGYPVGYCITSSVDPEKGLFYGGRAVSEMATWDPEAVIYLLYYGRQGNDEEVARFSDVLRRRAVVSPKVIEHIYALPREGHPMELFCAALLICGMIEGTGDYKEDCINVIAKMPVIAAAVINHHAGWGGINTSNPGIGYMENFAQLLNVPNANLEELARVFRIFNVLHYDHGGGNLSAFIGKGIASGLEDMYGSLAGAMCALSGPRHGKANQDCLEFVKEVHHELGNGASAKQVEELIRKRLANDQLVFGFGHAVLRVEDPRATIFYELAQKQYADNPLVKIALLLRSEGSKVLAENPKISDPHPNVDAISGTVLSAAGFPYPEYFTVLFGVSRCVGIARQIVYERCEARDGKGTPIIRPKYYFKERES